MYLVLLAITSAVGISLIAWLIGLTQITGVDSLMRGSIVHPVAHAAILLVILLVVAWVGCALWQGGSSARWTSFGAIVGIGLIMAHLVNQMAYSYWVLANFGAGTRHAASVAHQRLLVITIVGGLIVAATEAYRESVRGQWLPSLQFLIIPLMIWPILTFLSSMRTSTHALQWGYVSHVTHQARGRIIDTLIVGAIIIVFCEISGMIENVSAARARARVHPTAPVTGTTVILVDDDSEMEIAGSGQPS